jgi:hypothetical protein
MYSYYCFSSFANKATKIPKKPIVIPLPPDDAKKGYRPPPPPPQKMPKQKPKK